MKIQQRDFMVLLILARFLILDTRKIQQLCYPTDTSGRIARRRLLAMLKAGYIKRRVERIAGSPGGPMNHYQIDDRGKKYIAEKQNCEKYYFKPTTLRQPQHLRHYCAVAAIAMLFEAALRVNSAVKFRAWFNEEEIINWQEPDESKHRKLFTIVQEKPRITCEPDAAFVIEYQGAQRVCYIERERGTNGPKWVAKKKAPGYHLLQRRKLHHQHFPEVAGEDFDVLLIGESPVHRDRLRKFFREVPGKELWLFADVHDLHPETFFFEPVWYPAAQGEPLPLIQKQEGRSNSEAGKESINVSG